MTTLWALSCPLLLPDEEREAERGEVTRPRAYRRKAVNPIRLGVSPPLLRRRGVLAFWTSFLNMPSDRRYFLLLFRWGSDQMCSGSFSSSIDPGHSPTPVHPLAFGLQLRWGHCGVLWNIKIYFVAQMVKNLPAMQETWVLSLNQEDSPGEGNGSPLQYSFLENPMDRRAWWTVVHGVTKSQALLKRLALSFKDLSWNLSKRP